MLSTLLSVWNWFERNLIGLLAIAALALATYQMIARYLMPSLSTAWTGEVVIYVIVWAVFVSASQLVHEDAHIRADLVLRLLPAKSQRPIEIFNIVVALVFCLVLAYFGVLAALDSWQMDERSITALRFPMWVYYAALPAGFVLMALRYIRRFYLYLFRYDAQTMSVHSGRES